MKEKTDNSNILRMNELCKTLAQHLSFTFVNAGSKEIMNVVTKEMTLQKKELLLCVFIKCSMAVSFMASLPEILAMMHSSSPR